MQRNSYPPERRGFGRREIQIHAIARLPGRGAEPCMVRNYSDSGALLVFQGKFEPPDRFRLTIEAKGVDAVCEVRRRNGSEIGVTFVEPDVVAQRLQSTLTMADLLAMDLDEPHGPQAAAPPRIIYDGTPILIESAADVRRRLFG